MSALRLRRINAQAHAAAQAIRRWRSADIDAGSSHPPRQSGYLCFRASGKDGEWQGLIDAHDWLHRSLPGLRALLTVECSLMNIAELFRAVPQPLLLEVDDLHYQQISDVDGVLPGQLPPQELPWLDTSRGRLWLTRLPPAPTASQPLAADSWLSDLPLHLELMLGSSHLRHGVRLKAGDVLRIIQRSQRCCLGHQCLGFFTFTEQGIHMQSTVTDVEGSTDSDADFDLDALPVRLQFVLATQEIDLATLSRIVGGQLIPLADDAARHIEVRANGKPVARGELVQLEEQLGVELLEVYRDGSPDGMPR